VRDTNAEVAGLLQDLAAVQTSKQKKLAYARAATVIRDLEQPLEALVQPNGGLPKLPFIGPSSSRVVLEVLRTGGSPTVEQAVASSRIGAEVLRQREQRLFLSRAGVLQVLADPSLDGPRLADYRGDLQMHSRWSDGVEPLERMAVACLERGYAYAAMTDHSHGLAVANGMSMTDVAAQHEAIEAINARLRGRFRVLKGVEANIAADGSLDLQAADLPRFELVLAAPHAGLRATTDQTPRMIAAVSTPGVHVLAHPRGRKLGARAGIVADWPRVFSAAASRNVAVEIDGDPNRQDLDYELARRAVDAGCVIALDSDAHAVSELPYVETALAHARLAGIPTERIINTWPVERLLEWASARRG
jgi:histidinol phosphatase-like PHP family hydrolase